MAKGKYQEWLEAENLVLIQGWKRNGLTDEQIAHNMKVSPRTLERWKKDHSQICRALKVGHEQANFIIEGELFKKAMKGNTTAMIFWLKNNWRDKYNDSELSPEERKLAVARMKKLEAETKNVQLRNKNLEDNGADVEDLVSGLISAIGKEDKHESS
ncbi:small terminase subunit [Limosilactobacillus reuteri]|nr:small terminase subunit [Limosilactobacillus reuteri]